MNKIEPFLKHVEGICGGEGRFFKITDDGELPPIAVISYPDNPEPGCTTAFSFGLSSIAHPDWVHSRPELVISVNSLNTAWPLAMGEVIRNGRGKSSFSYGTVLNFGQRISDDSEMSAFFIYACTVLDDKDLIIDLPDRKLLLSQIYPIYQSEIRLIMDGGPEPFVRELGVDLFEVTRPSAV